MLNGEILLVESDYAYGKAIWLLTFQNLIGGFNDVSIFRFVASFMNPEVGNNMAVSSIFLLVLRFVCLKL